MSARNLADPAYEPSDDELRELFARVGDDARARRARAVVVLAEQVRAAKAAIGLMKPTPELPR